MFVFPLISSSNLFLTSENKWDKKREKNNKIMKHSVDICWSRYDAIHTEWAERLIERDRQRERDRVLNTNECKKSSKFSDKNDESLIHSFREMKTFYVIAKFMRYSRIDQFCIIIFHVFHEMIDDNDCDDIGRPICVNIRNFVEVSKSQTWWNWFSIVCYDLWLCTWFSV